MSPPAAATCRTHPAVSVTDNKGIVLDIGRFTRFQACKRQASLAVS
jgi:hypothetical protein